MKELDLEHWPRRPHFDYFRTFDWPQFSLCANMDITRFYAEKARRGVPFFDGVLYAVCRAANGVPELRRRVRGERVVEHTVVHPSATILLEDGTFAYLRVPYTGNFGAFSRSVREGIARVKASPSIEDEPGADDLLYITSLPWVSFTALSHPVRMDAGDSIPRISWGKYFKNGDALLLSLSFQAHHALADGLHAGRFYQRAQALFDAPEWLGAGGDA